MQPRALGRILQLDRSRRFAVIAEGLGLLTEHVAALQRNIVHLAGTTDGQRGTAVLAAQADEEAAKILILLDLVRMDQSDEAIGRQLRRFYNHLARCIYSEMARMRPATFAEVRRLVETMRRSHFLDGPNDVDWIFRNQLLAQREESLYVDYVHEEDGDRWVSPAANDVPPFGPSPALPNLVAALHRLGCTSRPGLDVIAEAWVKRPIDDSTHWAAIAATNRSIVTTLIDNGIASAEASPNDTSVVINQWPFPMSALDLSQRKVPLSDLQDERDRWCPL